MILLLQTVQEGRAAETDTVMRIEGICVPDGDDN